MSKIRKKSHVNYIVCYMMRSNKADYECFETLQEARIKYSELINDDDIHSCTITKVVESTDY